MPCLPSQCNSPRTSGIIISKLHPQTPHSHEPEPQVLQGIFLKIFCNEIH